MDNNNHHGKERIKNLKLWDGKDSTKGKLAEKKISIARVKLMQRVPFFGRMTLLLKLTSSAMTPTMGTDGQYLFYNPYFVVDVISQDELQGILLHEVLHCALLHLWRKGERDQMRWNIACDLAINQIVKEEGLILPEGHLSDYQYRDMASEAIYAKLPEPKVIKMSGVSDDWFEDKSQWGKEFREDESDGKGKGKGKNGKDKKDDKQKGDGSGKGKEGEQKEQEGQGNGKDGKDTQNDKKNGSSSSEDVWKGRKREVEERLKSKQSKEGKSGERMEDFWKGIFNSAIRGRDQGTLPGYLKRLWKELQPKKDWKKIFAQYLSKSTDDFNFSTPDRRFLDSPFILPDLYDEENVEDVIIAVDTSGSISTWQFNHFMAEVKEILTTFPKFRGWFIDCDAQINQVVEIKPEEEFKPKMMGGGGTDFRPVFKWIEKEEKKPRVLIYLTDGYGTWPDEEPDYPSIWLIDSEIEPPFGEKIQYEYDEGDEYEEGE